MKIEALKFLLYVQDMERAVKFYRDTLGLRARLETPHWSELFFGDSILALHAGGTGQRTETGLSIQVAELDTACQEAEAGGASIESPPEARPGEPIKLATLRDPEGNVFSMSEYLG